MNQYKYYVKGTISAARCYEDYREIMENWEIRDYLDEIEALFDGSSMDELAQYIHEDDDLIYGVVTEIWVGIKVFDGEVFSFTEITSKELLSDEQKKQLLDYLSGQFSDGYGEGLEQQSFYTYTEEFENEEYDEDEDEFYTSEYEERVECYLHLWTPELELEFVDCTPTQEVKDIVITRSTPLEIEKELSISNGQVEEWYHQEGTKVKFVYSALKEADDTEELNYSVFAGVEYENGTFWVYGINRDREVSNYDEMICQIVSGGF